MPALALSPIKIFLQAAPCLAATTPETQERRVSFHYHHVRLPTSISSPLILEGAGVRRPRGEVRKSTEFTLAFGFFSFVPTTPASETSSQAEGWLCFDFASSKPKMVIQT